MSEKIRDTTGIDKVQAALGSDRYRLEWILGRGGMSTVWLADDTHSGELVAIKILNEELSENTEFRERFRQEARAARSVSGPNVVAIHDYKESVVDGHAFCYIIMEYIRGESLADILARENFLPHSLVLDVLEQCANGLSAIHAAGLIHRDIKPGNLLVTPEGRVLITDFGIAKAASAVPLTRTGMVVGTAQYLSPEQAQGKSVTPATDIYSLGLVGYEMLAGRRPFEADSTVAIAVAHINDVPPPLDRSIEEHIRELIGIVLRKDPTRRYADGAEFSRAIAAVRQGLRPPRPAGVVPTEYVQRTPDPQPATAALGAMTQVPATAPTRTALHPQASGYNQNYPQQAGYGPQGGYGPTPQRQQAATTTRRKPKGAATKRKKSGGGAMWALAVMAGLAAASVLVVLWLTYFQNDNGKPKPTTTQPTTSQTQPTDTTTQDEDTTSEDSSTDESTTETSTSSETSTSETSTSSRPSLPTRPTRPTTPSTTSESPSQTSPTIPDFPGNNPVPPNPQPELPNNQNNGAQPGQGDEPSPSPGAFTF